MRPSFAHSITIVVSLLVAACGSTPSQPPVTTLPPSGSPAPSTPALASASASPSGAPTARPAVWLDAGELREPRNATNVVVLGTGEVLVVGSDHETSWGSSCGASTDGSDSVEIGDPQTGVWEPTTNVPSLRDAPVVVALPDGRALLTGGAAGESIGWSAYSIRPPEHGANDNRSNGPARRTSPGRWRAVHGPNGAGTNACSHYGGALGSPLGRVVSHGTNARGSFPCIFGDACRRPRPDRRRTGEPRE
jgi:hypothetical protein